MPVLDLSKAEYAFAVAGTEFAIVDLNISMTMNAPPQLQIKAVPKAFIDKKVINTSNAELFWAIVSKVDSVIGKPSATLQISRLGEDVEMNFNAQKWVLADIGLSASATAEMPATIDFSIQHPIVLLSKYPVSLGPPKGKVNLDNVQGNYLDVIKGVLNAYSDKLTDSAKKQPTYHLFQEGIGKLDEYLSCEGCNISNLAKLFPWVNAKNLMNGFKEYILACATTGGIGSSLYSFVAQTVASELSLGLYMDPSDLSANKLILKPRVPFSASGCAGINPSMTINMSNSQGDWLSPSGVYTSMSKLRIPNFNHPEYNGQSMQEPLFVSVIAKDGGTQIVPVGIPGWVNGMLGYAFSRLDFNHDNRIDNPQSLDFSRDDHAKSVQKILTQYFLDMYRQSKNIAITRLFSIYDDNGGHQLIPGISCVMSGGTGGLAFLITSVQHQFSLASNQASTIISGNYVRGSQFSVNVEGAEPSNLITSGFSADTNYIWG
jgi:hypothetical protein